MLTNNQPEDIIQPMIVLNALNAKLKGETPMTDTMMIRDCIRSQGMKLGHGRKTLEDAGDDRRAA